MTTLNLLAAWIGMAMGMLTGAIIGLAFHRENMLGGYDSWRRRLVRLGHISFFGLAFVNLAFVVTVDHLALSDSLLLFVASRLLIAGAVLMPTVCFLSAWRKPFRHLFALPVSCLVAGAAGVILQGVWL
jgi:hypothetical protein